MFKILTSEVPPKSKFVSYILNDKRTRPKLTRLSSLPPSPATCKHTMKKKYAIEKKDVPEK